MRCFLTAFLPASTSRTIRWGDAIGKPNYPPPKRLSSITPVDDIREDIASVQGEGDVLGGVAA